MASISLEAALQQAQERLAQDHTGDAEELCWKIIHSGQSGEPVEKAKGLLRQIGLEPDAPPPMRLHIGGTVRRYGWMVFDAVKRDEVDVVGEVTDLSAFQDNSFSVAYASHVLEHLRPDQDLPKALREIHRVLVPGGVFFASVPDIEILSYSLINPLLNNEQRDMVVSMMFGNHANIYDGHKIGFRFNRLAQEMTKVGFTSIGRVRRFPFFHDSSEQTVLGIPISINVIAGK